MKRALRPGLYLLLFFCCAGPVSAGVPLEPLKRAPEITSHVWFNVESFPRISIKSLRGDVIVVVFWSYMDAYSKKAMAYINDWYARYQDEGLVVIGVHSKDWGFDMTPATVAGAVKALQINFPVALDEDSRICMAYGDPPRPSLFLIDREGFLRAAYVSGFSWENVESFLRMLIEEGHSRLLDKL